MIISGSARPDGDTAQAVERLRQVLSFETDLVDLGQLDLRHFAYGGRPSEDDFDGLVERMLGARSVLFATPVYWYAMSGRMKVLFDRFTDLLSDRDSARRGRHLAGRAMWMLAVGVDPEAPEGFAVPFRRTAEYLDMDWRGDAYLCAGRRGGWDRALARFATKITGQG